MPDLVRSVVRDVRRSGRVAPALCASTIGGLDRCDPGFPGCRFFWGIALEDRDDGEKREPDKISGWYCNINNWLNY